MDLPRDGYTLVIPYGLGDTYHVAAHCESFKRAHPGDRLHLVVKQSHEPVARMFGGYDELIVRPDAEINGFELPHRVSIPHGEPWIPHPNFFAVRPDRCVAHGRMSDAAMFAMIMGLPPATPLALPRISNEARQEAAALAAEMGVQVGHTMLIVPDASSCPPPDREFFNLLADAMPGKLHGRWYWTFNDRQRIPLRCFIPFAELCGWVVGANCGLMQVLVEGRAACRKTVLTSAGAHMNLGDVSTVGTFPFSRVCGEHHDIEEFRVGDRDDWARVIDWICAGRNALGPPVIVTPSPFIEAPISPGEVADRLSILTIKLRELPQRHMILPEYSYIWELYEKLARQRPEMRSKYDELVALNEIAWKNNQILADAFDADQEHAALLPVFGRAYRANKQRVRVKNEITAMFGSPLNEAKSYT